MSLQSKTNSILNRHFETEKFKLYLEGSSYDLRTNKWTLTSKCCNKSYSPPTTMSSKQVLTCPSCGATEIVNYNDLK